VLVIVHLSSLDAYAWHAAASGQDHLALELGAAIAGAISAHNGPVIVVDQQWDTQSPFAAVRLPALAAVAARPGVLVLHFDEATSSWRGFLPRLRATLDRHGVPGVRLGGLWRDLPEQGGCVSRVARYLRRSFQVRIDPGITGGMHDFGRDEKASSER